MLDELVTELGYSPINISRHFRLRTRATTPPINVEFLHENDKYKFLNKDTKQKLRELPPTNKFHGVSVTQDRTFKQRQDFKSIQHQMRAKIDELINQGNTNEKWIIRNMRLIKVKNRTDNQAASE